MGTLVSFAILDTIQISLARKSLDFDPVWLYIVLGGLMTFIVIHILKKGTRLLKDPV
jgi:hypothetical protein